MQKISVFGHLHGESSQVRIGVFKEFHFGHCFYFAPDRSASFGLVMCCRENAWPIHKNILPLLPLALPCKRSLTHGLFFYRHCEEKDKRCTGWTEGT